ncbi:MAG TPA: pyridoxamine 5'-phosphate oxidase family protein [Candidatus Omnitrophota bacterium]|nr:pyridoxamine 5'-phosphate oxidase family protein [Candidatus Omnitrophota bacterium]
MRIDKEIINFFESQDSVIVSTLDEKGCIHCSIKGIISAESPDNLFLIDLYLYRTFRNLKRNPMISITAFDDHLFKGYTLQGQAEIITRDQLHEKIFEEWEKRVVHRISKRIARSVQAGFKSRKHHEAHLPLHPKYLIKVNVENVVDLAPPHVDPVKEK